MDKKHLDTNSKENGGQYDRPYWKRAHHDWKFWIVLVLMVLAMGIYLGTEDLSIRPHGKIEQRVP